MLLCCWESAFFRAERKRQGESESFQAGKKKWREREKKVRNGSDRQERVSEMTRRKKNEICCISFGTRFFVAQRRFMGGKEKERLLLLLLSHHFAV